MDPIKIEKLQAMKRCRKKQVLPSLFQYSLILLSILLWLFSICSNLKTFFLISLPNLGALVFGPKCLFIVCNIIIIFLVGESKLSGSSSTHDIYDEYVKRNKGDGKLSSREGKGKESKYEKPFIEEVGEEEEEEEEKGGEGRGYVDLDGEGTADELNKRVEDFIARVNKQRRLEAKMLVCDE